jgi:hypothetical protein
MRWKLLPVSKINAGVALAGLIALCMDWLLVSHTVSWLMAGGLSN